MLSFTSFWYKTTLAELSPCKSQIIVPYILSDCKQFFIFFIFYALQAAQETSTAHTPDSMVNVLRTVKEFAKGRTVAVFGCGGDRDRTKRPLMGKAAADWSDFAVVTTDNPRTEQPEAIIEEILPGFAGSATPYQVVVDRVEAIHWAMDHAQKEDVIVLCGKGHETYQEINHKKYHMDEREIVADYLKSGH